MTKAQLSQPIYETPNLVSESNPNFEMIANMATEISALQQQVRDLEARMRDGDRNLLQTVYDTTKRTTPSQTPNANPLTAVLRDVAILRWNSKLLGATIAKVLYDSGAAGAKTNIPPYPTRVGLTSKLCRQSDIEANWLRYWCGQLGIAPLYGRKIWELAYVLQAIWEAGFLERGRRGLGFAVGAEPIPAFLCSRGLGVTATDLAQEDERSINWRNTNQHASTLEQLYRAQYLERADFDRLCEFRPADMNAIPRDFDGLYDFCWSMCSFEHVGSLELGLQFVQNSMRSLKPGGLAVHTTEFSFERSNETIDKWPTVLFQARHISDLEERLKRDGHTLLTVDYDPGSQFLDMFIDHLPYTVNPYNLTMPPAPHLRLNVDGFACSSIGLIIRKAA